jgi:hypothetical protein
MDQFALEIVKAFDIWPLPVAKAIILAYDFNEHNKASGETILEHSPRVNEDVNNVFHNRPIFFLHFDRPLGVILIPNRGLD